MAGFGRSPTSGDDIQDVQFQWPFSAVPDQSPEIRPTLEIHFDDLDMVVGAAGRTSQRARDQAATFIARLLDALAGRTG
jgi:hypothetical protein